MTCPRTKLPPALLLAPVLLSALALACGSPPSGEGDENADDATGSEDPDGGDDSPDIICAPGETRCTDTETLEVCGATGLSWEESPCATYEVCESCFQENDGDDCVAACVGPCERLEDTPSSEGCSFYTTSMLQASQPEDEEPSDAIVVGNPQPDRVATVELRYVPEGSNIEELAEGPIEIQPGESFDFELDPSLTIYQDQQVTSLYRSGAVYHVVSDLPVVAYLHAPFEGQNTNGSTLLLPESVLQNEYVVLNHWAWQTPNYFTVIAMEDQTTVTWTPPVETAGDSLPLPFVEAGETGQQLLNRFDNMRINTSSLLERPNCEQDLSGTVVTADKPIWLVSAVQGMRLPFCGNAVNDACSDAPFSGFVDTGCNRNSDFAMEQNLPLAFWGQEYVGPHSPLRGSEDHYWRVFAGDDDIEVNVTPPQPGWPVSFALRGEYRDLVVPAGTNLVFDGNGPFMPVQYLANHYPDANDMGSPAMVQMVPTAQFLDRYVFVTGKNYDEHYVQVIRDDGGADVTLTSPVLTNPIVVSDWTTIGDWQVATVLVDEGPYEISSDGIFGIIQYGYSEQVSASDNSAGYGYMGGMKAEIIFIP